MLIKEVLMLFSKKENVSPLGAKKGGNPYLEGREEWLEMST